MKKFKIFTLCNAIICIWWLGYRVIVQEREIKNLKASLVREREPHLYLEWFGAKSDAYCSNGIIYGTDNSKAFEEAMRIASQSPNLPIWFENGVYLMDTNK